MKKRFWINLFLLFALSALCACQSGPVLYPSPTPPQRGTPGALQTSAVPATETVAAIGLATPSPIPPSITATVPSTFPSIQRSPAPFVWKRAAVTSIPGFKAETGNLWQVDLRSLDLRALDLRGAISDLGQAYFDSATQWPAADQLPAGFDPQKVLELGKNPGLGLRKLHEQGISGKGVGIAIIDQPLLTNHQEIQKQLRFYEETSEVSPQDHATMHGTAVASLAVGQTVGTAPEADLYYIGTWICSDSKGTVQLIDYACMARSVRRILAVNAALPAERKIRVLAIQAYWTTADKGMADLAAAMGDAKASGLLVVCPQMEQLHGFKFDGLGRDPLADPDAFSSYGPGYLSSKGFFATGNPANTLWVPMDSRSAAGLGGPADYAFFREEGWSWAIPYIAGVYALAAQVKPSITPEEFWATALQTGQMGQAVNNGQSVPIGPILDPTALIAALQK